MIRTILFTGHMIDKPGRKKPRFPPGKEEAVKQEIQRVIAQGIKTQSNIKGIAGGACGGDIIFHEVCLEMGVLSEMFLTLPVDEYKKTSVSFAGPAWDARFDLLQSRIPVHVMSQFKKNKKEDNIWEQTNVWMLDEALNHGIQN